MTAESRSRGTSRRDAPASPQQIVVADDDLLFSTNLSGTLTALGYRPLVVRTEAALLETLRGSPRAAIVNLAARGFEAAGVIARLKDDTATRGVPILGFCGHRDVERLRAAKAAGCDEVATNGAVAGDLGRLLTALIGTA